MDEDGYFYIVDRVKDMVIVSGFKVFTRELDDMLAKHPDIDMAAAIGIPDPERPGRSGSLPPSYLTRESRGAKPRKRR